MLLKAERRLDYRPTEWRAQRARMAIFPQWSCRFAQRIDFFPDPADTS